MLGENECETPAIFLCTVLTDTMSQDLEFVSLMVQKLNLILITSPELAEFRRRLKNLENRVRSSSFAFRYRLKQFLFSSKMDRHCSRRCTDRGVITPSPPLPSAFFRRLTNMLQICCPSCKHRGEVYSSHTFD